MGNDQVHGVLPSLTASSLSRTHAHTYVAVAVAAVDVAATAPVVVSGFRFKVNPVLGTVVVPKEKSRVKSCHRNRLGMQGAGAWGTGPKKGLESQLPGAKVGRLPGASS